mgnify:CR=1 FL=1
MKVTVDGNKLIIEMIMSPHPSKSGKTTIIASTHGNKVTDAIYNGKAIIVGLNAYINK